MKLFERIFWVNGEQTKESWLKYFLAPCEGMFLTDTPYLRVHSFDVLGRN